MLTYCLGVGLFALDPFFTTLLFGLLLGSGDVALRPGDAAFGAGDAAFWEAFLVGEVAWRVGEEACWVGVAGLCAGDVAF